LGRKTGDLIASQEVAVAFAQPVEEYFALLGIPSEGTQEKCDYLGMLDEREAADAVVAAKGYPHGNHE
jgi:hypothetical protein